MSEEEKAYILRWNVIEVPGFSPKELESVLSRPRSSIQSWIDRFRKREVNDRVQLLASVASAYDVQDIVPCLVREGILNPEDVDKMFETSSEPSQEPPQEPEVPQMPPIADTQIYNQQTECPKCASYKMAAQQLGPEVEAEHVFKAGFAVARDVQSQQIIANEIERLKGIVNRYRYNILTADQVAKSILLGVPPEQREQMTTAVMMDGLDNLAWKAIGKQVTEMVAELLSNGVNVEATAAKLWSEEIPELQGYLNRTCELVANGIRRAADAQQVSDIVMLAVTVPKQSTIIQTPTAQNNINIA